jgi:hypothetical protein
MAMATADSGRPMWTHSRDESLKSIRREIKSVDAREAAVMVAPARHAEQVRETPQNVCRWPTMAIRELTMAAADSALAADPLFHLGPGGHVGRIEVRY